VLSKIKLPHSLILEWKYFKKERRNRPNPSAVRTEPTLDLFLYYYHYYYFGETNKYDYATRLWFHDIDSSRTSPCSSTHRFCFLWLKICPLPFFLFFHFSISHFTITLSFYVTNHTLRKDRITKLTTFNVLFLLIL